MNPALINKKKHQQEVFKMVSLKNDLLWVKCSIYETVKIQKFRICGLSLKANPKQ